MSDSPKLFYMFFLACVPVCGSFENSCMGDFDRAVLCRQWSYTSLFFLFYGTKLRVSLCFCAGAPSHGGEVVTITRYSFLSIALTMFSFCFDVFTSDFFLKYFIAAHWSSCMVGSSLWNVWDLMI